MKIAQRLTKIFTALSILFFLNSVAAKAQSSIYTLPIGTKIRVRMDNEINSKVSSVNDTFTATVSSPVMVRDAEIIPKGSIIEGRITAVKSASAGKTDGSLEVKFETLRLPEEAALKIDASLLKQNLVENKSSAFTALSIFGGTAIGAVVGAITGKGTGAAIGAGLGAGAGTIVAFSRRGKEAKIKADEEFEIVLNKEVTVPAKDY
jgi:hypothetical protein